MPQVLSCLVPRTQPNGVIEAKPQGHSCNKKKGLDAMISTHRSFIFCRRAAPRRAAALAVASAWLVVTPAATAQMFQL
jgi:hypothetical protein